MKKSLIIIATVAVLGIFAAYKFPAGGSSAKLAHAATTQTTAKQTSQSNPNAGNDDSPAPQATSNSAASGTLKDGSYTGSTAQNRYEDITVSISVSGGKITSVNAQSSTSDMRSDQYVSYAVPTLKQQTLSAQSASLDGVSGATFTTYSYEQSLQSAIDKAKAA